MTTKETKVFRFYAGQVLHLDQIYNIQGIELGTGQWWKKVGEVEGYEGDDLGDEVVITKNITITITVEVIE